MSTRTYNLRARVGAGVATQANPTTDIPSVPRTRDTDCRSSEIAPLTASSEPETGVMVPLRTYSEVVASRPPSRAGERPASVAERPTFVEGTALVAERPTNVVRPTIGAGNPAVVARDPVVHHEDGVAADRFMKAYDVSSNRDNNSRAESISSEGPSGPEEEDELPWSTVERKRAPRRGTSKKRRPLTAEQAKAVQKAAEGLTDEQRKAVQRRQAKVRPRQDSSVSSRGQGTSRPKGKMKDPHEWGNVDFGGENLDPGAQAAALAAFGQHRTANRADPGERPLQQRGNSPSRHQRHRHRREAGKQAESQPAAQIAPKSYLGTALKQAGRPRRSRHPLDYQPSEPSSDPSYSPSDDDSWSGRNDTGSESDDPEPRPRKRRRDNRHGRNRRRRRSSSSSSGPRSSIKPIPPKEYDGAADVRAYHRFVRESDAYLRDGKVRGPRKVFLLSYFLTGKAYDFYTQKVAINEDRWSVPQFYTELFNYCFPVDYRMQLRKTLARCHQNDKSVAEYTHELQELFNMIGDVPKQDQVIKFWNGARPAIQKELWKSKLNPELSSWRKVVSLAEIIEIADNVAERRDRKSGQTSQPQGTTTGSSGGKHRHPHTDASGSVRAVTFEYQ